ncbi:MAG: hypothetical protein CL613_00725 [Aquimarina sp.]|nr:hypothetical protein [Aquimarina sp.]
MNKIFLTTLLLMLTVSSEIFSQDYNAVQVLMRDGTRRNGFALYSDEVNPFFIMFKETINENEIKLTSNQIAQYSFNNLNRGVHAESIDGKEQFVELLVKGKSNLLLLKDRNTGYRFFLKSEKSGLKELTKVATKNSTKKFVLKKYIGILSIDFNDCPEAKSLIVKTQLTISSLSKIF